MRTRYRVTLVAAAYLACNPSGVTRGDMVIDLTTREFELLEYLLRHSGHFVSREMLAREVWKETRRALPLGNSTRES